MSLDEEQRAELRRSLHGDPSRRRLVEIERLASAIAAHGRKKPAVDLLLAGPCPHCEGSRVSSVDPFDGTVAACPHCADVP